MNSHELPYVEPSCKSCSRIWLSTYPDRSIPSQSDLNPAILKLRPDLASLRSVPSYNPAAEEISRMLPREFT
jgi:hypothetical protein